MRAKSLPLNTRHLVPRASFFVRYGVAAVGIIASALLYAAIDRLLDGGTPFLAFTPAVMAAAWFGGLGPGLFATILGGLIGNFFWVAPLYTFVIVSPHEWIHTFVFYAVGIALSLMSRSLERARANAVAANGAKDHFLAVLSHELRNPLSAIVAASSALEENTRLGDEGRHDLKIIRRNVTLQALLIDDLLDISRVSHGKILLQFEVCAAQEVLGHALDGCRADALAKGLNIRIETTAASAYVRADPARLQQIFWNLLRNAIKFTPSGGTVIARSKNEIGPLGEATLIVEVQDTGRGIPPQDLWRIFEPFEQGSSIEPQKAGGLGLGLALCKALVALHGGTIRASSPGAGQGATFTVELPTVPTPAAPPPPQVSPVIDIKPANDEPHLQLPASALDATNTDAPSHSRVRILLVEDDPDSGPLLLRLLRHSGYDVTLASRLDLALREARRQRIDLLISDLSLPDGNGIDLLREIRARQPVRGICVSGYGSEVDQETTRRAGFERHLVKPVTIQALREAIEEPERT
jgi:signal transduction histidine kinase